MKRLQLSDGEDAERIVQKLGTVSGGWALDVYTEDGDFIPMLMKTLRGYECFVGVP